jgi:hypothetical protein
MKSKYKVYLAVAIIGFWFFQSNLSKVPQTNQKPVSNEISAEEIPSI